MKLYKLTNKKGQTYNNFQWKINKKHKKEKIANPVLCSNDVFHAYTNKNLAILLNPIHADIAFTEITLWEAKGKVIVRDFGKVGCSELTLIKKLQLPIWTKKHAEAVQIMFAILCAETVLGNFEKRFPDDDRPRNAIDAAKTYLKDKSASADYSASARAAYYAADYAASASDYAASAAYYAASAAYSVASASARAAYSAADYAARAADYAASASARIDFTKLADTAVKIILKEVE